jgi:hypothetical protein
MIPLLFFAAAPGAHLAVSVDTSAMVGGGLAGEDAQHLRRALLVRLVEEGYIVVTPSNGNVQIWLTVRPDSTGWSVEARAAHVTSYHVDSAALPVLSLEILQRATMALDGAREDLAARGADARSNAPSSSPSMSSGDSLVDGVETQGKKSSGSTWEVGAAASGGILARSGGVDPIVQARFDLRAPPRIGGRLQAGIDWSGTGPLSIVEWHAQIGPTWSPRLHPSLTFTTGLLAGILVHQFRYSAQDNGSRTDWNLAAPAELTYRIGWATLGGALFAGISERPRDHEISGSIVWHRGSYYVGVSAGLGVIL